MNVLGIETSCDETSAAVVDDQGRVLSNVVYSQIAKHQPYGGVVPEIACRSHVELIPSIMGQAVEQSGVGWDGVGAVAATRGPGLVSSLLIGLTAAKALALRLGKPLVGVNHLEAHLYSIFLAPGSPKPEEICPFLMLLVSGGHTCLLGVDALGSYRMLGQTLDDAAGEALDKGSKLLNLGYPGGPAIEKASLGGDPSFFRFPRGLQNSRSSVDADGLDRRFCFSFSGLKTALLYYVRQNPDAAKGENLKHVAASYQEAVFDTLLAPVENALKDRRYRILGCAGGVARNNRLREKLDRLTARFQTRLLLAAPDFCTDNAAMVAAVAAVYGLQHAGDPMTVDVQPNLPLC
ncbi:MAG: tRNA (adenosine(37)-N6)-threonylcarbamoyltransferase complex transferase subunit TsaD [Lentisphaerota bacterium]